jgi:hypothetical protein
VVAGTLDWGTVPAWVAAVGTGGALIASVIVLGRQRRDRGEDIEERLRDQARHVAAWSPMGESVGASGTPFGPVIVRNGSSEPIYDVVVRWVKDGYDVPPVVFETPVMPPRTDEIGREPPGGFMSEIPPLELSFTDARGNRWTRWAGGSLTREPRPRLTLRNRAMSLRLRVLNRRKIKRSDRQPSG